MKYCVEPRKRIGRLAKRWDDQMQSFAQEIFHSSWFQAAKYETRSSHETNFCRLGPELCVCVCVGVLAVKTVAQNNVHPRLVACRH